MPFLAPALPFIGAGASALGALGQGRAQGRQAEANANQNQDQLRLQAARLNLEAPGQRASNSVRGDILANVQPVSINGPITHTHGQMPQITGGLSPALLSQNTRQLGGEMSRDALLSQMQGAPTPDVGGPGIGKGIRQAQATPQQTGLFQPTPLPQKSGLDTFLNGAGIGGDLLSLLEQARKRQGAAPTQSANPANFGWNG